MVSGHGLRFDLRVVPPECYGNLLQHFTGSKNHNIAMREEAQRRGLSISEYGVLNTETGETITHRDEKQLYEFLGYQLIPPELRENAGELEAAREGSLPKLVELKQLKGDLHTHTTWSADGHNTVEEMALEAIARGYEYLAITDHSHYLREGRMEAQDREIDAVNEEARAVPAAEGRRGQHPRRRLARRAGRGAGRAGLGRRVAPLGVPQGSDRARVRSDGEPARRLHRAPHGAEDRPPRERRHRPGSRHRDRRADGDGARDQLPARPARHAGSARAAGGRGGRARAGDERRAPGGDARLRRARDRPGAAGLADEEARAQHALVGADREDADASEHVSRGRRRGARVGGALPGARGRAARARAGRARLCPVAAAGDGAGAGRAVLRGAEGRRRGPPAGDDALAAPAVLRVLRQLELGAGDPRGAARRRAQPERDPLADVAGLDRAGRGRARLGGGAARAADRLARAHRGHGVDLHSRRARCGPRARSGEAGRRRVGALPLVGREGGEDPRSRAPADAGRRRVSATA